MSTRPLRIAIDVLGAPTGGGMTIARKLVEEMAQQRPGHRFLLYHAIPEVGRGPYPSNVETFAFPACRSVARRWLWEQLRLPGMLRRDGADVLLCLSGFTSFCTRVPQVAAWQNASAASRLEIRRRWSLDAYIWAQRQLQGLSMRKATMNVFVTHELARLASQRWHMERIPHRVIHHGIDRANVARSPGEPDSTEVKALSIGHTYHHKNYENLIDAIDVYRRRYPEPISLTIVGGAEDDAYDQRLRQRIAKKQLSGVVEMVGAASPSAVVRRLASASVYVTTSLLESFGLTTLEAMASGVPVVASDATCFPEVCGDAALYCDPLDPEDIARALHRVGTDAELRERLREQGHARVELFGWERCAGEYLAALEEAAVGSSAR